MHPGLGPVFGVMFAAYESGASTDSEAGYSGDSQAKTDELNFVLPFPYFHLDMQMDTHMDAFLPKTEK